MTGARKAAIPIRAHPPVSPNRSGAQKPATVPANAPSTAPMKTQGPRTPPEPPDPREMEVARIFRKAIRSRRNHGKYPQTASSTVVASIPRTWGKKMAMKPVRAPPRAGLTQRGSGRRVNTLSEESSIFMNRTAASPQSSPRGTLRRTARPLSSI